VQITEMTSYQLAACLALPFSVLNTTSHHQCFYCRLSYKVNSQDKCDNQTTEVQLVAYDVLSIRESQ